MEEKERIICQKCIYYYVTWQDGRAHGCKAYGFKSKTIPSMVVKSSSRMDCKLYYKKPNTK